MIVDDVIQHRRSDLEDAHQQQELLNHLADVEKKWSSLHLHVKEYRDVLAKANAFHKLYEEIDIWTNHKTQVMESLIVKKTECTELKEIELILHQVRQILEEVKQFSETKVKYLTQLAVQLYGENQEQPKKVKHIVTKNVELLNNLIQLKSDTESLKQSTLAETRAPSRPRSCQLYHDQPIEDIERPPDFKKRLESAVVFVGSRHIFECFLDGCPFPEVKWFFNGQEITDNSDFEIVIDEKTGQTSLTLRQAKLEHSSAFSCRIANDLGTAETSAYLKVKEHFKPRGSAPLIVTPLESIQLNSGSNYTLECIISGEPEPQVTWFKDHIEIESLPEPVRASLRVSKFMNVRQLVMQNVQSDSHSGTYTCRARNEYGEADCSCGILIRSKPDWSFFNFFYKLRIFDFKILLKEMYHRTI